jgi:hypothetical protein
MVHPTARPTAEPARPPSDALRHLNQLDLARRWRISIRTLERWRWLRQGPPYLKLGGAVVYRLQDVEAFEAEQRLEPAASRRSHARGGV